MRSDNEGDTSLELVFQKYFLSNILFCMFRILQGPTNANIFVCNKRWQISWIVIFLLPIFIVESVLEKIRVTCKTIIHTSRGFSCEDLILDNEPNT